MSLKVTFQLTEKDLRHFRAELRTARAETRDSSEIEIIQAADEALRRIGKKKLPDFIRDRLYQYRLLIEMLIDKDWDLPSAERRRIRNALSYFAAGDDLIPDDIPALGFLDDAIMLELVIKDLAEEISAFEDFRKFRKVAKPATSKTLRKRRGELVNRIRRRRERKNSADSGPRLKLF